MNPSILNLRRRLLAVLTVAALSPMTGLAAPGAHGPNGEHLDQQPVVAGGGSLPRIEARSESYELVASLEAGQLVIVVDRYETNEPVLGARLEVESGAHKAVAAFRPDSGDYAATDAALLEALAAPGEHALVFTLATDNDADLLDGTRWAAGLPVAGVNDNPTPARVINLSFGGDAACSPAYQSMVDDVRNAGALLVVAAGNNDGPLKRPADCKGVMAVGAVTRGGLKADYASFGTNVALSAPGGSGADGIYNIDNAGTTTPGANTYGEKQGTSFSAPQAVGVASLMLGVNPALSPAQLIERMQLGEPVSDSERKECTR